MKIIVSSGGRFHLFHLAEQLQKKGYLYRFITNYFNPQKETINSASVIALKNIYYLEHFFIYLPFLNRIISGNYLKDNLFDVEAKMYIKECDIFVGIASFALYSMRSAKNRGAITILERGSSHIIYAYELLKDEYEKHNLNLSNVNNRLMEKQLREYEEVDYISVPSRFVYNSFIEKGVKRDKLILVPYGVNLNSFRQAEKKDKIFRIIFVGNISLRKGIHYLLESVCDLKLKNFELILIGNISDDAKYVLKRYEGYYKHLGNINHHDLYKLHSNSSVFILPSIEEGLAMVIAEAMACGLPVIVTKNTGGEEIVRNGIDGFIIPVRDSEAIKEKILYFYENEDKRQEMGDSAREYIKKFSWDRYGDEMVKAYKKVLSKR
jgi:glycosyltransferase involved in cell wall biosynthesis